MGKSPYFFVVLISCLLTSCLIPGARREQAHIALQANDSLFHVQEGKFNFRIVMPKDLMISQQPTFELCNRGKQLNIRCGSNFNIVAHLNHSSEDALESAQQADRLFTYDILDQEDQSVVFSRLLPDGRIYDYRLIQELQIGDRAYTFQTADDAEFDLPSVLRMRSALASVQF